MTEALDLCAKEGFNLDGLTIFSSKETDHLLYDASAYGCYRPDLKAIIFRHDVDWDTLAKKSQQEFPDWAQKTYAGSPIHLALHELGHYFHHQNTGPQFSEILKAKINKPTKQLILKEMGHSYPTTNAGEAAAELFAGLMAGKTYSPELISLHKLCKGPVPRNTSLPSSYYHAS